MKREFELSNEEAAANRITPLAELSEKDREKVLAAGAEIAKHLNETWEPADFTAERCAPGVVNFIVYNGGTVEEAIEANRDSYFFIAGHRRIG